MGAETAVPATEETAELVEDSGEQRLRDLGYQQGLERSLGYMEILHTALNSVSLLAFVPYYGLAYLSGGPVACVWYWWIAIFFVSCLMLTLSEVASSLPTAGTLYFWAAYLAKPKWRRFVAFATGWLEFIGIAVGAAAGALLSCQMLQGAIYTWTGGALSENSVSLTDSQALGVSAGMLVMGGIVMLLPVKVVGRILSFSAVLQYLLVLTIIIALPIIAPTTQPASFVFGHYEVLTAVNPVPSQAYAFVLALQLSQFSTLGSDSAAHVSEEAAQSDRSTPVAIMGSLAIVAVFEWAVIVALTFSIQGDPAGGGRLFAEGTITGGTLPVFQIIWDCFHNRFGTGVGANIIFVGLSVVFFFSSATCIMASARTAYALSRDGGMPLSGIWCQLDSRKVPVAGTVLTCAVSILSCLFLLISTSAFSAIAGTCIASWCLAYGIVVGLRLATPEDEFEPGPFYLPRYVGRIGGKVIYSLGLLYVVYTTAVFMVPSTFPITINNFNWCPLGVAVVLFVIIAWWFVHARFWYKGPHIKGQPMETLAP